MSLARRLLACAAAPVAWFVTGCNFDALGLGSTTQVELPGTTGEGTGTGTTAEPMDTSTGSTAVSTGEPGPGSGGESCVDGCAPMAGWTATTVGLGGSLVRDAGGDVIVAGDIVQANDATYRDVWVARFAAEDGAMVWQQRHAGHEKRSDYARELALAGDGTIVAVGGSREHSDRRVDLWVGWFAPADGALISFGNLATGHWNGADPKLDEWAEGLAITPEGDLIIGGQRCQVPCQVPDAWIGRFTADGKAMWPDSMLNIGPGGVRGVTLLADDLIALGTEGHEAAMAPWRSVVRRFAGDGAGTWSARQEADTGGVGFEALAAAVAPDGGLWVVGREFDPIGGFARLYMPDRDDRPLLEAHTDTLGGKPAAIVIAQDGTLVLAGATGDGVARHLWVGAFRSVDSIDSIDMELAPLWKIEEPVEVAREARGVVTDGAGGLIVLGVRDAEPGGEPGWLRRYVAQAPI